MIRGKQGPGPTQGSKENRLGTAHLYKRGMQNGLDTLRPLGRREFNLWMLLCSLTSKTLGLQTFKTDTLYDNPKHPPGGLTAPFLDKWKPLSANILQIGL